MLPKVSILSAIGLFAATVAAIPSLNSRQACTGVASTSEENANFDDLDGIEGNSFNPIPEPYHGLRWQGFTFANVLETDTLPGPLPHSGHRYAVSQVLSTTLQGTSTLTYNFADTNTSSFDLHSFYYGVVLQTFNGATALDVDGYIQVTGYSGPDGSQDRSYQVCSQQLKFESTGILATQYVTEAVLDSCFSGTGMTHAVFTYNLEGGLQLLSPLVGIVLDDVRYALHYCG